MVLAETLRLADQRGLDAVSMRAVADRLGVTPMALYRHVGDKRALLDGLVERLLVELPPPDPGLPWAERLGAMATALRAVARRHPTVFPLLLRRPAATEGALRVREALYDTLRDAGLAELEVRRGERMLSTFMIGFAASESGGRFTVTGEQLDEDLAWLGEHLVGAIATHTGHLAARPGDGDPPRETILPTGD